MFLEDLTIGIWTIHSDGITCRQPNNKEAHAGIGEIWAKRVIETNMVWDLPVHIASKDWVTEEDIFHLLQAMAIYRKSWPLPHQGENFHDVDERTTEHAFKKIRNRKEDW